MITYKKGTMIFTGKDYELVQAYATRHNLTFKDVVYLALMNGLAAKDDLSKNNKKRIK